MPAPVLIWADGSSGMDGSGGWAAVLLWGTKRLEICGGVPLGATNNTMEMQAVIEGLSVLKKPVAVRVHSDSAYVVNCFLQGWIKNWRVNGWRNSAGNAVANREYWETLEALVVIHDCSFVHVRGHSGDRENERCDQLAHRARLLAVRLNKKVSRRNAK